MLFSLAVCLIVAAILIQVAVFSTTIYLHRTATHKALVLHPAVEWMFKFALWLTTGLSTKEWVAVHRKHHAFTDEEGDPHSPKLEGFWKVQLGNVFYYMREVKKTDVVERYARDIDEGWWDRTCSSHGLLGLAVGTVALCLVHRALVGAARGGHSRGDVRVRAVVLDQRPVPPRRLQELRQHRDQHPLPRAAHRRRRAAQQPPRLSAQPEIQLPRERDRSRVAGHQAADRAAGWRSRTRRSKKSPQAA